MHDRSSGAVEAFHRRNASGAGQRIDRSKDRASEDASSSKDVVSNGNQKMLQFYAVSTALNLSEVIIRALTLMVWDAKFYSEFLFSFSSDPI